MTGPRSERIIAFAGGSLLAFWPPLSLASVAVLLTRDRPATGLRRRFSVAAAFAAVLWSLPLFLNGETRGGALAVLQVLSALGVVASSYRLASQGRLHQRALATGLATGLAVILVMAGAESLILGSGRAELWMDHPNLLAHQSLLVAAASLPLGHRRASSVALGGGLGIAVFAGSRSAVGVGILIAVAYLVVEAREGGGPPRPPVARHHLLALMLFGLAVLLIDQAAGGRFSSLFRPVDGSRNLVVASEMPRAAVWFPEGVTLLPPATPAPARGMEAFGLQRTGAEAWSRLQQPIALQPGTEYTASAYIATPTAGTRPGYQGWAGTEQGPFELIAYVSDGRAEGSLRGPGRLLGLRAIRVDDVWIRLVATFRYEGRDPLPRWMFGLAPDQTSTGLGRADFAGVQLEAGRSATPYDPTGLRARADAASSNAARRRYWGAAVLGFLERPSFGHGEQAFRSYISSRSPSQEAPAHAHSLLGQVAFARGIVGLAGLTCLLLVLAPASTRPLAWLPLAAALLLNVFDYTLLHGGVLYPLALAAGASGAPLAPGSRGPRRSGVGASTPPAR